MHTSTHGTPVGIIDFAVIDFLVINDQYELPESGES